MQNISSALSTGNGMNILGYDYAPGIGTYHVLRFNTDSAGNLNWGAKSGNINSMPEPFDACMTANDKLLIAGRYFEVQGFIYQSDAASMHSCYDTMITLNTLTLFVTDSVFIPLVTSTSFTASPQALTVAGGMSLLNICTTTSLPEITQNKISMFPNPASDHITFSRPLEDVCIYNSAGKLIQKVKGKSEMIHVSELSEGFYWLVSKEYRSKFLILR